MDGQGRKDGEGAPEDEHSILNPEDFNTLCASVDGVGDWAGQVRVRGS